MDNFPDVEIAAERLVLRPFAVDDVDQVRALLEAEEQTALPPGAPSDPEYLRQWLGETVDEFRRDGWGVHLMMQDRASGAAVGAISLFKTDWEGRSAEVGYGVRSASQSKGYATEAVRALTRWALTEGGMQRIQLTANTDNTASLRVAEKAGFLREGTLRRASLEADGLHDLAVFSRLDDD